MNRISVMGGLFAAFMLLIVMSRLVYATSDVIGTAHAGSPAGGSGEIDASPVVASASGTLLQALGVNISVGGNGNLYMALYSDSGGLPSTLLCSSTSQGTITSGWDYLNVSACGISITEGTTYWIAEQLSSHGDYFFYSNTGGRSILSELRRISFYMD